jgi:hypothetical protein
MHKLENNIRQWEMTYKLNHKKILKQIHIQSKRGEKFRKDTEEIA